MSLQTTSAWGTVLPSMTIAIACFGALMVSAGNIAKWRTMGLVIFLLIAAFDSVDDLLLATGAYHAMSGLFGWSWPGSALYGSALYLYVSSMTAPRFVAINARAVLAFVTPALVTIMRIASRPRSIV